ncbi:ABC transporter substrate-binding protein [Lacrimispora sp.]|uniref:ABC transporter substrate-binding protein n=1 Tax=Lacrimispora sp. TaxID=2719234 RepID=UPI002FDA7EEF
MKKILSALFAAGLALSLAACGNSSAPTQAPTEAPASTAPETTQQAAESSEAASGPITITLGVPASPPTLPILRMKESKALGDDVEIKLDLWNEPETLIAMTQDGAHDMFAFPLTVVSTLYNKGIDVRLMNVNTWGVNYFITSDPEFKTWADLKGKTLYVPLQSSPPDALSQYFIAKAGLTVGTDVNIVYGSTTEIASLIGSGEAEYAVLLEPQVTKILMSNENLRIAFSFEEEWQKVNETDTKIPTAGFGASQKFIEENPELAARFQEAYKEAVKWINENPAEAGVLAEKELGMPAKVVEKAIPNMGLEFKSAVDSKEELDMFYQMLFDFEPKMIGGKIPDSGIYYEAE